MKICCICCQFPSKTPTTLEARQGIMEYRQILKLSERGHKFKIISVKWNGQSDHEVINDSIEVFRIPYLFLVRYVMYPVPNFIKLTRKIIEINDNWEPDIFVYCHAEYVTAMPVLYLNGRIKAPSVVTLDSLPGIAWFYGNRIVDLIGYFYIMLIGKNIFKAADGVQLLGSEAYKYFPKLKVDMSKVFVIPRGTDIETYKPRPGKGCLRQELGIETDDIVILYVGRLDLVKGIDYLLSAARDVAVDFKMIKFVLVGEGELRGMSNKYKSDAVSFSNNIIFTGFREDVADLMNISDIFILPSLSEGAANVVLEASASGLPVIASSVGEVPNIVLDGRSGILVKPRDVNGLIAAIRKLVENPFLAKDMGAMGRRRIEQKYTWNLICSNIESIYEAIIERRKALDKTNLVKKTKK